MTRNRPVISTHIAVRSFANECARLWPGCRAVPRGGNRWHDVVSAFIRQHQRFLREQEDAPDASGNHDQHERE
jgi:hypothetical protein